MRAKYRDAARGAPSHSVFLRVMALLHGELNSSHLGFRRQKAARKSGENGGFSNRGLS
jgi:hypothetical protein